MNNKALSVVNSLHPDFIISRDLIYIPCGFKCREIAIEKESLEYGACQFKLNDHYMLFRVAKITPTKVGQFVTVWKRIGKGPIQPYDLTDGVDFYVIAARKDDCFGQFVFPKDVLCKYGIMSTNGQKGKLGMRVYPPWDVTMNKQAKKTQEWQLKYFLEVASSDLIDIMQVKMLYVPIGKGL